jgi:hypothetical protein
LSAGPDDGDGRFRDAGNVLEHEREVEVGAVTAEAELGTRLASGDIFIDDPPAVAVLTHLSTSEIASAFCLSLVGTPRLFLEDGGDGSAERI